MGAAATAEVDLDLPAGGGHGATLDGQRPGSERVELVEAPAEEVAVERPDARDAIDAGLPERPALPAGRDGGRRLTVPAGGPERQVLEALCVADDLLPHVHGGVDDGHPAGPLVDTLHEVTQACRGDGVDRESDGRPALHVHDRWKRVVQAAGDLQAIEEVVSLDVAVQRVVEEVVSARGQPGGPGTGQVGHEHRVDEVVVLGGLQEDERVAGLTDPREVHVAVVVAHVDAADECIDVRQHRAGRWLRRVDRRLDGRVDLGDPDAGSREEGGRRVCGSRGRASRQRVALGGRRLRRCGGRVGRWGCGGLEVTAGATVSARRLEAKAGRRGCAARGSGRRPSRNRHPIRSRPARGQGRSTGARARRSMTIASAWASATTRGMVMVTGREYRRRPIRAGGELVQGAKVRRRASPGASTETRGLTKAGPTRVVGLLARRGPASCPARGPAAAAVAPVGMRAGAAAAQRGRGAAVVRRGMVVRPGARTMRLRPWPRRRCGGSHRHRRPGHGWRSGGRRRSLRGGACSGGACGGRDAGGGVGNGGRPLRQSCPPSSEMPRFTGSRMGGGATPGGPRPCAHSRWAGHPRP